MAAPAMTVSKLPLICLTADTFQLPLSTRHLQLDTVSRSVVA
jgi:hypothetical protein